MSTKYSVLIFLCLGQLTAGLTWYNYSAVLPLLQKEWALTGTQAGVILSVFQAGYVIAVVVCGFLSDKIGGHKVFMLSAIETSLAGLAFAFLGFAPHASRNISGSLYLSSTNLASSSRVIPNSSRISEAYTLGEPVRWSKPRVAVLSARV
ncbi:MFS transporter [Chloroflexota bacterium]